jgi:hypothetical protein
MNLPSKTLAVALLAATSFAGTATAAPLGAPLSQDAASSMVQTVQWRGGHRGWGGGGWGGGWRGGWRGPGWGAGAGLAAGAIIGGAVAASQPWYGYNHDYAPGYYGYGYDPGYADYGYAPGGYVEAAPGGDDVAYCQQRFRSYDPASGTYLGYDGYRHPCP